MEEKTVFQDQLFPYTVNSRYLKVDGTTFTSSNYPKCKLICILGNLDLNKSPQRQMTDNKQSKCIFDSDRRFDLRRIRDIRVPDIEIRL